MRTQWEVVLFAPDFSKAKLIASETASRRGVDNEPSEKHELNLVRTSWFLQSLLDKIAVRFPGDEVSIYVSSGYRGEALNKSVGGSNTSAHVKGLAADISCNVLPPYNLAQFIQQHLVEEGFDQIIQEFGRWVHVGLTDKTHPRLQTLTAYKENGVTKYKPGIHRD